MTPARMPLVLVEWVDPSRGEGWRSTDQIKEYYSEPAKCRSVGWLLLRTKKVLIVLPHISGGYDGLQQNGIGELTIPLACVKRVKKLRC